MIEDCNKNHITSTYIPYLLSFYYLGKMAVLGLQGLLREKEDTQDIDCTVLRDVSASIHEITKDIADPLQEITA